MKTSGWQNKNNNMTTTILLSQSPIISLFMQSSPAGSIQFMETFLFTYLSQPQQHPSSSKYFSHTCRVEYIRAGITVTFEP